MLKSDIRRRRAVVGQKLKDCRQAYGIKQKDIMATSGLFANTVVSIECGGSDYSIDSYLSYCVALITLMKKAKEKNPTRFSSAFFTELSAFINHQHQYTT